MAARQGDAERAARERLGVLELAPDVAVEAVEQALRADRQQAVARFDLERFQGDAPLLRRLAGLRSRETPALVASLRADPDTLDDRVAAHVRALLTELTGRPLTLDASIQALGLDSMSALDAAARLREDLGVELHVTRFLRDTPVHELARELAAAVRSGQTPAPADPPPLPPVELPAGTAPPAAPARAPAPSDFDIGLFFFSRVADDDAGYRLLQDAVQIADRAGLGSVWLPERHFHAFGGLYPNPSVLAASLAPLTERIRLRAGSVVLPLHHPARVAEEWAVVDRLSGGRVDLAFVRGWGPDDFALRPEDFDGRTEVLERRLDEVRRLWRGEAVPFVNGAGETRALRTWPRPVQPELPVWLTCTQGDERFLAAGRLGVNVLTALLLQSPDELERRIALYRSALADHGHDPSAGRVALMVHAFVGRDDAFTRDQVREPLTRYIDSSVDLWKQASAALQGADRLARDQILAYAFERYYETSGLFGPVSACVRKAAALRALGVDELACLIDFGVDDALVLEGIRHLPAIRAGARA